MNKEIVYIDMDDTICEYNKAYNLALKRSPEIKYPQSIYGFFRNLDPIPNAIESINALNKKYDVWILTRPSYKNPLCYTEKRLWVEEHLGLKWCNKLILCPDKSLMIGQYLIDDILWPDFKGKQIQFGTTEYPNWKTITNKLL